MVGQNISDTLVHHSPLLHTLYSTLIPSSFLNPESRGSWQIWPCPANLPPQVTGSVSLMDELALPMVLPALSVVGQARVLTNTAAVTSRTKLDATLRAQSYPLPWYGIQSHQQIMHCMLWAGGGTTRKPTRSK